MVKIRNSLLGLTKLRLLWMANLGCIEMNPWFSRIQSEDYPDFCIIDLDPDKNTFDQVIKAALEVKKVLDLIGVPSYPKTSRFNGYSYIYTTWLQNIPTISLRCLQDLLLRSCSSADSPSLQVLNDCISNRKGKMYVDFLQNRPGSN